MLVLWVKNALGRNAKRGPLRAELFVPRMADDLHE
jgi:hypothetical protein